MRAGLVALGLATLVGAGCAWVPLEEGAEDVRVRDEAEVASCEKLGWTRAKTADRVLIFARRQSAVEAELEALAINEAADLGGDVVVPTTRPVGGEQAFDVYRCGGP